MTSKSYHRLFMVMDFNVNIQDGVDCSSYEGNYPSTAIEITTMPFNDTKSTSYCYFSASKVYSSPDIFYKYIVGDNSSMITVSLCGSNFDTYISVQDTGLHAIFYNDDSDSCTPSSEITFLTDGLDTIYIVVEGYGHDTGTFTLNVDEVFVDALDEDKVNTIQIYPNPATSNISILGTNIERVKIYDLHFKEIYQSNTNFKNININTFSKGIHFVEINTLEGKQYKKLIIE